MGWTAIIPLKHRHERKTRLAACLDACARAALSDRLFDHVARVVGTVPAIGRVVLLSPDAPAGWQHDWIADEGRGLNAELAAARAAVPGDVLVIHADLPLLARADVEALLAAATAADGVAIAPDRHGLGTNALALAAGRRLTFGFGAASLAVHRAQTPGAAIVRRDGLALDIDTAADLALAGSARWMDMPEPAGAPA